MPRQLFFFEFIKAWKFPTASSLCNETLNIFLTRWGNYSREKTVWGNTVSEFFKVLQFQKPKSCRQLPWYLIPLCNENLDSFLTRWGNYSREETIWGNTVSNIWQIRFWKFWLSWALKKLILMYLSLSLAYQSDGKSFPIKFTWQFSACSVTIQLLDASIQKKS